MSCEKSLSAWALGKFVGLLCWRLPCSVGLRASVHVTSGMNVALQDRGTRGHRSPIMSATAIHEDSVPCRGGHDDEARIDQALEDSFPASDPPPWTLGVSRQPTDVADVSRPPSGTHVWSPLVEWALAAALVPLVLLGLLAVGIPVALVVGMWTLVGTVFAAWFILVVFFTPRIDYRIAMPPRLDDDEFLHVTQATCQTTVLGGNHVDILTNGSEFYPAMLEAIRAARTSVNLEAYIFEPGELADSFIDALAERARAGVDVRIVLDSIGSSRMRGAPVRRLRDAGCVVNFYQPISLYRLHRLNNRTHRELLIVDGTVAFTGGAGAADWWAKAGPRGPAWRDTMARLQGPIVTAVQGVFAENWLECSGEILVGLRQWPRLPVLGATDVMVVKSSPSDRATASRVLFQMLIEGSAEEIAISTPYFLPDRSLRRALAQAARRGVRVRVLVPGRWTDQRFVRLASRRMYHELLASGVRLFEYRAAMMHVKALMVDRTWAVIGSTNVDNRSFEHNDEVNVAVRDVTVTARLLRDFEVDLKTSDELTSSEWASRPIVERLVEPACWILERQQ